jgi:hypothetical protein
MFNNHIIDCDKPNLRWMHMDLHLHHFHRLCSFQDHEQVYAFATRYDHITNPIQKKCLIVYLTLPSEVNLPLSSNSLSSIS